VTESLCRRCEQAVGPLLVREDSVRAVCASCVWEAIQVIRARCAAELIRMPATYETGQAARATFTRGLREHVLPLMRLPDDCVEVEIDIHPAGNMEIHVVALDEETWEVFERHGIKVRTELGEERVRVHGHPRLDREEMERRLQAVIATTARWRREDK
jgi:hypothetical protein